MFKLQRNLIGPWDLFKDEQHFFRAHWVMICDGFEAPQAKTLKL